MKKIEMAEILCASPAWGGIEDPQELVKLYSKEEIQDAYNELTVAESEYYDSIYKTPQEKYDTSHCKRISLKLNLGTDADILAAIEGQPAQTAIKALIRAGLKSLSK